MIDLKKHAENYATIFELPVELVLAIIKTESAGSTWALRVEPHYRYLYDIKKQAPFRRLTANERNNEIAPKDFSYMSNLSSRNTEWLGQQASWGCMQVMGAVAREYGYRGPFPQLCDPGHCIYYGCQHLNALKKVWYRKYRWVGVAAAYNAGSVRFGKDCQLVNQHYVDTVASNGAGELFNNKEGVA